MMFNCKRKHSTTLRAYKACYLWQLNLNDLETLISIHPHIRHELIESYSTSFAYEYDVIENKVIRNNKKSPFSFKVRFFSSKSQLWQNSSLKMVNT